MQAPQNAPFTTNRLLLILAALLFSTGGAAIKACSLPGWQIASFRSGIAAIALYAFLPGARQFWSLRTIPIAIAYAATLVLFVTANKLTTSANAIFLQSTGPIYMLALGPLVLRERLRSLDWLVVSFVAAGAALLFGSTNQSLLTAPSPSQGNTLAAISGLTWALTLTGLRIQAKRHPTGDAAASTVIAGNVVACVAAVPFALPFAAIHAMDAAVLLYLGVVQIGIAYLALTRGIRKVPGLEAATILLVEPVFNPIWSWLLHNERPGAGELAGGALILLANLGGAAWESGRVRVPEQSDQPS